jgi:hypothetical protein
MSRYHGGETGSVSSLDDDSTRACAQHAQTPEVSRFATGRTGPGHMYDRDLAPGARLQLDRCGDRLTAGVRVAVELCCAANAQRFCVWRAQQQPQLLCRESSTPSATLIRVSRDHEIIRSRG